MTLAAPSMRTYECPSCGAAVNFVSGVAVFSVCEHCRSMVVRTDVKLEAIGAMAELPPDLSPLQIGSHGRWRDLRFTLLGRVRLAWEQGSWTEWYAEFEDGRRGWVAETQGFFELSFLDASPLAPKIMPEFPAGTPISVSGQTWTIIDRKEVTAVAAEGELPFVAQPGATHLAVDLSGPRGEFGSIERFGEAVEFYVGAPAVFSELNWENLRPVPGWSGGPVEPVRRRTHTLACPHCAAPVTLRAEGLTMSVVCGSCGTILDTSHPQVQVVQRAEATVRSLQPALSLGLRGNFGGAPYEVIGLVEREDDYSSWFEYLLFNPWHGFLWLVTYRGHWTLVHRLLEPPFESGNHVTLDGERFALFAQGTSKVKTVIGEFYWRVSRGEESDVSDYVCPPRVASKETYPDLQEETWSAGHYVSPREIETAFALPAPLPGPSGPYLNAPNPYAPRTAAVLTRAILAAAALLVLQLFWLVAGAKKTVFDADYTYAANAGEANDLSTPAFHLEKGHRPLSVEVSAGVTNSWLDLDVELVNTATGATQTGSVEVAYYSGRDSDGDWSEGRRRRSVEFPAVPAGDYLLRLSPSADPALSRQPYHVQVTSGGVFWSNFFLCLGLVALYPAWIIWRRVAFERERWSESDFSPYSSSSDND